MAGCRQLRGADKAGWLQARLDIENIDGTDTGGMLLSSSVCVQVEVMDADGADVGAGDPSMLMIEAAPEEVTFRCAADRHLSRAVQ